MKIKIFIIFIIIEPCIFNSFKNSDNPSKPRLIISINVFILLVLEIAILSVIVIIEPYARIIIIPVVFHGITLILTGILSFIIYSKIKTIRNRNLILGYVFMCISDITKAIEIIYFDNNHYFSWNPLLYALRHYYFYSYFTHKSKHNHAI